MEENTIDTLTDAASTEQVETPAQEGQAAGESNDSGGELLAGKYKSSDELEKAYKELETKVGGYKDLETKAQLVDRLSQASGYSIEQIEGMIKNSGEAATEAAVSKQPSVSEADLKALKAEVVSVRFDREFDRLPEDVKGVVSEEKLRELYLNKPEGSVKDIVDDIYGPVIKQVRENATRKLEDKAAANVQSAQGSGPVTSDAEKQLHQKFKESGDPRLVNDMIKARLFKKK